MSSYGVYVLSVTERNAEAIGNNTFSMSLSDTTFHDISDIYIIYYIVLSECFISMAEPGFGN